MNESPRHPDDLWRIIRQSEEVILSMEQERDAAPATFSYHVLLAKKQQRLRLLYRELWQSRAVLSVSRL